MAMSGEDFHPAKVVQRLATEASKLGVWAQKTVCEVENIGKSQRKEVPSGKRSHNYGKSSFLMGKSTISMVIFNSTLNYQRVNQL